jgi:hypothetical protein
MENKLAAVVIIVVVVVSGFNNKDLTMSAVANKESKWKISHWFQPI